MQIKNALKRINSLSKLVQENQFDIDGSRAEQDRLKVALKQVKLVERKLAMLQTDSERERYAKIGKLAVQTAKESNVASSNITDAIVKYGQQENRNSQLQ